MRWQNMSDDDKKEKLEKVAQYLDGDKEKLERAFSDIYVM